MKTWCLGLVMLAFAATTIAQDKPLKAIVVLLSTQPGVVRGNITFTQTKCGEPVLVDVAIEGLSAGLHGFHVHEKGDYSGGCNSFGGHFNPDKLDHGARDDQVRHVGDLGNVNASGDGVASTKFSDSLIQLAGPRSIIGRGIVVHEKEDDLGRTSHPDSKKTGNAGGRVACGIIGIAEPVEEWPCTNGGLNTVMSFTVFIFTFIPIITSWLVR